MTSITHRTPHSLLFSISSTDWYVHWYTYTYLLLKYLTWYMIDEEAYGGSQSRRESIYKLIPILLHTSLWILSFHEYALHVAHIYNFHILAFSTNKFRWMETRVSNIPIYIQLWSFLQIKNWYFFTFAWKSGKRASTLRNQNSGVLVIFSKKQHRGFLGTFFWRLPSWVWDTKPNASTASSFWGQKD